MLSEPIIDLKDCVRLASDKFEGLELSYRKMEAPNKLHFPYYYACIKLKGIWTLISTKLSDRYEPVLIDNILNQCPYEIDVVDSYVEVGLSQVSALVSIKDNSFIKHKSLVPAYLIINSYNGSSSISIYVGCKNKDTNYFMPFMSHKILVKHNNMKDTVLDMYKVDVNKYIQKSIDFIEKTKLFPISKCKTELVHICGDSHGSFLYDSYLEQTQKFLSKSLTPTVVLEKVRTIEDLFSHIFMSKK